jgi:hypothetical protein
MPSVRTAIATGSTLLALGGLTAVAVSSGGTDQAPPAASQKKATPTPPAEVRTVVVTKVIHRTRRAKVARHRPSAPAPAAAAPAPAPAPVAAPAATSVRIAATPAPASRPAVSTHGASRTAGDDGHDDGGGSDD